MIVPSMSQRHFEFVASILAANRPPKKGARLDQWIDVIQSFADKFAASNSTFSKMKFIGDCWQ